MAKSSTTHARRLVSINQAAEYANVHPITVRRWVSASRLPAFRIGPRLLKIDMADLEAMLRPVPTGGREA